MRRVGGALILGLMGAAAVALNACNSSQPARNSAAPTDGDKAVAPAAASQKWIRDPQQVSPGTAMPDLSVGEGDARDITAFLYSRAK